MNEAYKFSVGEEIGLMDIFSEAKEDVVWYSIGAIEPFDGINLLYLVNEVHVEENIHTLQIGNDMLQYAEIIDSISSRIVLP